MWIMVTKAISIYIYVAKTCKCKLYQDNETFKWVQQMVVTNY